jgi:hypothetical protein
MAEPRARKRRLAEVVLWCGVVLVILLILTAIHLTGGFELSPGGLD